MKKILTFTFVVLLLGCVFAGSAIDNLFSDPESAISEYNANIENVPNSIKSIIGNETVLINVVGDTQTRSITLVMKKALVETYSFEENDKVTLVVDAKEEAINRIILSENRIDELKLALKNKEITYKAKNVFKKMKFGFAKFILKFVK